MTAQQIDAARLEAVRAYYATNDEALLGPLLADLRAHILRYIRATLRVYDPERAADIAQESMTTALARLRAQLWQPTGSLGGWACGIARIHHLEGLRRTNRQPSRPGANEDPFLLLSAEVSTAPESRLEEVAGATALVTSATRAVLALDEHARAAVVLHFFRSVPEPDAAQQLGIPVSAFRARLSRGLASLSHWARSQPRPTAETYAALRHLDTGDLFTDYGLRLAS